MKNLIVLFLFLSSFVFGQGLIVNEISNGSSGTKEYIELLVIGNSTNPLSPVDLSGWIIDDNNGDFEAVTTGVGIASGHIRIKSGCLTSVLPGTIIVVYNNSDINLNVPLVGNDCLIILADNDTCLETCSGNPSTSNSSYFPCSSTTGNWNSIGLANSGDVAQVRRPDGTFYNGFCYGGILPPFPPFPSDFGSSNSFNIITGSGLQRNYFFNCGSFVSVSNYTRGTQ